MGSERTTVSPMYFNRPGVGVILMSSVYAAEEQILASGSGLYLLLGTTALHVAPPGDCTALILEFSFWLSRSDEQPHGI